MGSMPSPIRVAVLECDTPLPQTKARYQGYGGVFEAMLRAGAKASSVVDPDCGLSFTKHQIQNDPENYPDLNAIDAILITGSRYDSFADTPWILKLVDFTAKVLAQERVRTIGVCFGHQIIGRALGVKVGRNDAGWETAVNDVQLSKKGKELFRSDNLSLHQMHRDMVFSYPDGVEELGYSPVCKVQGMYVPKRLITVQGHPEFNQEIMTEILESRHAQGIFNDEVFDAGMVRVVKPHDGLIVSRAFLEFLLD